MTVPTDPPLNATTSSGRCEAALLDVGVIRQAREVVKAGGHLAALSELSDLLQQYDLLAVRYAMLCAADATSTEERTAERMLREVASLHRLAVAPNLLSVDYRYCAECGCDYPCTTTLLIEGKV